MSKSPSSRRRVLATLLSRIGYNEESGTLGDFTLTLRVIPISGIAILIGVVSAYIALILLKLIYLFTEFFFYQRLSFAGRSPANNALGPWVILVPVIGGLIVGVMSRYGSERIRGHGIPEAIEAILLKGSRVEPRVALFKPLSSAIAIGSGGPFGAEGPIIMTGAAFGSLIAQFFQLTANERKTLLVAGAAAGMAAVFASPVAATLLGVELLLFEWKPRSFIPVGLASVTAVAVRRYLPNPLGPEPLFPAPHMHGLVFAPETLVGCVVLGLLAGMLAMVLSEAIYAVEDGFSRLPLHWMWWPTLGGVVVGVGGYIFPTALGVGYDVIGRLLSGNVTVALIVGILLVKSTIWALSLGTGTSGGILAPLLMMGGALGAAGSFVLHSEGAGFWALIAMSATLAGAMGAPLTATVFAVELTRDVNTLLPLLIACTMGHMMTALVLRRSILTEKIARHGLHLSREYMVDPLETVFIHEVMRTNVVALPESSTLRAVAGSLHKEHGLAGQWLYPIVDAQQILLAVLNLGELQLLIHEHEGHEEEIKLSDVLVDHPAPVVAYPDEPLSVVVLRMERTGYTRMPVVERRGGERGHRHERGSKQGRCKLVGMVALSEVLKARGVIVEAEHKRERALRVLPMAFLRDEPRKSA